MNQNHQSPRDRGQKQKEEDKIAYNQKHTLLQNKGIFLHEPLLDIFLPQSSYNTKEKRNEWQVYQHDKEGIHKTIKDKLTIIKLNKDRRKRRRHICLLKDIQCNNTPH